MDNVPILNIKDTRWRNIADTIDDARRINFVNAKRRKITSNYCDHCEINLIHLNPCVQFEFTHLTQPRKLWYEFFTN